MFIQFLIFPPVARRFGVLNCLRVCTLTFPFVYILTPFTALLPTPLLQQSIMFALMLVKCWAVIFAFPCSTILLTNSAVSLRILGTLNGVATSASALGRAVGPAVGGSTFSLGVDVGYVIIPWWTLATLAALGSIPAWWLVEMEGFGGAEAGGDEDEVESGDDGAAVADAESGDHHDAADAARLQINRASDFGDGALTAEPDSFDDQIGPLPAPGSLPNQSLRRPPSHGPGAAPISQLDRRMSSPIGLRESPGPGGGRRLSNGLGTTMSGYGTGGSSYH